jgi:tRNA modification GTPase
MPLRADTIFALSSGAPPSGVAVVRISGPACDRVVALMCGSLPEARRAVLRSIRNPVHGELLDRGLLLRFPGPASATGEDCAEFHLHGGRAVVSAVLSALEGIPGCRPAEPGEFTRRAFEAGRLDLTAVEALADLVSAETEAQRVQALRIADGAFARRTDEWRDRLLALRAAVEANLDFVDQDDVPADVAGSVTSDVLTLASDVGAVLADGRRGERIRDGLHVAILGPPNAGKSSLLNALSRRDVAIVTPIPGTTRDVVEVRLDLDGWPIVVADTAGFRVGSDPIEREGIRRAGERGRSADVVLWLDESGAGSTAGLSGHWGGRLVSIRSKADDVGAGDVPVDDAGFPRVVSVSTGIGLKELETALAHAAAATGAGAEPPLITRERHRRLLEAMAGELRMAASASAPEIVAEHLRAGSDALGRLTGRLEVEDVLGAIFSRFCIGK